MDVRAPPGCVRAPACANYNGVVADLDRRYYPKASFSIIHTGKYVSMSKTTAIADIIVNTACSVIFAHKIFVNCYFQNDICKLLYLKTIFVNHFLKTNGSTSSSSKQQKKKMRRFICFTAATKQKKFFHRSPPLTEAVQHSLDAPSSDAHALPSTSHVRHESGHCLAAIVQLPDLIHGPLEQHWQIAVSPDDWHLGRGRARGCNAGVPCFI